MFPNAVKQGKEKAERGIAMKITSVSQTPDSISFSWKEAGGSVRVLKDGKEVYSGSDSTFTDRGLTPGTLYTYVLAGSGVLKIQTSTAVERDEKNQDIPLQELIVTTVLSDGEVAMAWEPIRGVEEYEIHRNGQYAGTISKPGFHDTHLGADESYIYEIKAVRPLEVGSEEASQESSPLAKLIDFLKRKNSEDDLLIEAFYIEKEIGQLSDHLNEKAPVCDNKYELRYTTFLEDEWIANPNVLSTMRYFSGDGRSFDPEGKSYRTRADVKINGTEITLARDVGESEGYSLRKELVERKTASDEGIVVKSVQKDEEKMAFMLNHSVGNPLVAAPDIVYKVYMTFYQNGVFDLSGEHDDAPNHEVYLKPGGSGKWKPLHRAKSRGLERLAPPTAKRFWRYSNVK